MSEAAESSHGLPDAKGWRGLAKLLRVLLYSALAAATGLLAYSAFRAAQETAVAQRGQNRLVAQYGLIKSTPKRLATDYQDRQGDLLADPPSDVSQFIDPEKLVLAYYEGDAEDEVRVDWPALQAAISAATGKPLEFQTYQNSAHEVAAVKAGKIQLVALHGADVPFLVNNAGYLPAAVLGTAAGASGNHLVIATGIKSKIKTLEDIRSAMLTCTRPNSITGYRAAIVVLSQLASMQPDVDYNVHFSLGQKRSIQGLINGEFTVAALSADKLKSMVEEGEISENDYRVVYESEVIPRMTFGHTHKLRPELAAKIMAAVAAFPNQGAESQEAESEPFRFVPIDYKRDFEFVRMIDSSFDPRLGQQLATPAAP